MNLYTLQRGVESRDDRLLDEIERYADFKDDVDSRAVEIARQIILDPARLSGFFSRGDIMLHELIVRDAGRQNPMTAEELIAQAIALAAANPLPGDHPLNRVAYEIERELSETADVRDRATADARAGVAESAADAIGGPR